MVLSYILASVIAIGLISFTGVFFLAAKPELLDRIVLLLVAFASGTLLGGAFLHLIPESIESAGIETVFFLVLVGFFVFFLLEKFLYWRHCHKGHCDVHSFTYMNLVGDGIHNFIDGLIIAAAYLASVPLGISTTIAIVLHEIPQEIGDFGVLVHGGFSKGKALFYNFLSALAAILGAAVGLTLTGTISWLSGMLLPFAAGGFVYVAAADLIPELHKKPGGKSSLLQAIILFAGIAFMYAMKLFFA